MTEATQIYDYEILRNPTREDVNRLGAMGYRVHSMALDPRDGALAVIIMERAAEAVLIEATQTEYAEPVANGNGKRGRGR